MELFEWMTSTTWGESLLTLLVSMVPVIELRGGVPFGTALGLAPLHALVVCIIGNMLPIGLWLFVAIPLPGTGAWTGALIAALLDMPLRKSIPSIFLGVVTAGLIMTFVTGGVVAIFAS